MGPERAARAAEWFLERFEAVALISAGCAGALAPGIERAAVVVPHLILRDVDLAPFLPDVGLQRGLVEAVHRAQLKPREGSLLTSGRPILNRKARQRAHVRSGAVAVDMESATIAAVARRFEIPFAGLRVILDPVPKQPIAPPLPWLLKSIPDVARHLTAITSAFLRADLPLP
jgi:adenosylhomocysteine nucleosidase